MRTKEPRISRSEQRRLPKLTLIGTVLVGCVCAPLPADVTLSPTSNITIVEKGPFDSTEGMLRDLLERYLLLALGKESLSGPGTEVTFVIQTNARTWGELPPGTIEEVSEIDALEIVISGSPQPSVTIIGQTPLAAGFGVMYFLENHLEIFWAFPGDLGLCLPQKRSFLLADGQERVSPRVISRAMSGMDLRHSEGSPRKSRPTTGVLHDQRAFFLAADFFKSMRLHPQTVHHNMIKIFPVEECKVKHPEVFPLREDGTPFIPAPKERAAGGGKNAYQAWHPCYTNPKTLEIAVAKGRSLFEGGGLFYSLGINDGNRVQCRCDECRHVGWPQSYYRFVNQVADALDGYYPPRMVGVLAYGDVGIPPRDLELRDNVLVNVAGVRKSVWESLAPSMGTYEYIYGAGFVVPNLPLDVIQSNFRYYADHNLRMYYAELYPVWAFDAPKAHLISRLLWDPKRDVHEMLRTFCDRAFGSAAEPMCRYYEHIASIRKDDARRGGFTPVWGKVWPFRDPLQFVRCPADLHQRLFVCLNEAKAKELTARQMGRIEMVEAFTEFSAVYCEMYRLKEAVFAGQAEPTGVMARAAQLQARSKAVFVTFDEHPEWFEGSSMKRDGFQDRAWPIGPLDQQLQAAVATAAVPLEKPQNEPPRSVGRGIRETYPVVPLRKPEHPWYKPTQHLSMVAQRDESRGFSFATAPNVIIRADEDHRHAGQPKAQWLHATAKNLADDEGVVYELNADLEGRFGTLRIELLGTTRTRDREKFVFADTMEVFSEQGEKATRRIVIDPARSVGAGDMDVQLHLLWKPNKLSSQLGGNVYLRRIKP